MTPSSFSVCFVVHGLWLAHGKAAQTRLLAQEIAGLGIKVTVLDCYPEPGSAFTEPQCKFPVGEQPVLPSLITVLTISPGEQSLQDCLNRIAADFTTVCFMEGNYFPVLFDDLKQQSKRVVVLFPSRYPLAKERGEQQTSWRLVDQFIAVSKPVAEDLSVFADQEKITVIGNCLEDSSLVRPTEEQKRLLRILLKLNPEEQLVLYSGGIQEQKGTDLLLEEWRIVHKAVPAARLVMIGPLCSLCDQHQDYQQLNQRGKQLLHKKYGLFTGRLAPLIQEHEKISYRGVVSAVHDYMLAADLLVFPSQSEGRPNTILEGMAAGLPLVAVDDYRVIGDLVREGKEARLFDRKRPGSLAHALISLLQNPEEMKRFGVAAQQRFRKKFVFDSQQRERFVQALEGDIA